MGPPPPIMTESLEDLCGHQPVSLETQYGEEHLTQTPTNLKLKHNLKFDVHTVSHVEFVVFAERVDEPQMRRRVGEPVGVLLVDPRRFGGLLALLLGRELVVE